MDKPKTNTQSIGGDAHLTARIKPKKPNSNEPDWSRACEVCGERPVVPSTGMCGPCTSAAH
jgi:hypothetical protein